MPRDEMEGMIAAQMLACHDTAMGCFRDALNSKLHGRLWHEYLEQTGKLTRAPLLCCSTRSIAIAGRGQQKITVEATIRPSVCAIAQNLEARPR